MGDFFHGWRRKIGVATLMMACVFAAGWVRSFEYDDYLGIFDVINGRVYYLQSANGRLLWYWQEPQESDVGVFDQWLPYCIWATEPLKGLPPDHFALADRSIVAFRWGFQWFKFGGNRFLSTELTTLNDGIQLWFPYWSLIVPLMLLSAHLLLIKPLKLKPPVSEPRISDPR